MANASYTQVGWEDSPSTNTPINESNLGHMDQGISDAIARANASIPTDNILSENELGALTQSGKYVADALVVKSINSSLTSNNKTFQFGYDAENDVYGYIKAGADSVTPFKTTEVYFLGTGTSFDLNTLIPNLDYTQLSEDNFIVGIETATAKASIPSGLNSQSRARYAYASISYTWSSETGVLTCSANNGTTSIDNGAYLYATAGDLYVYLVVGEIIMLD